MWFDTLVLQLRLHMAYRVNGILYRLRFLSLSYESGFAKTLGLVLAILRELLGLLLGKLLYMAAFFAAPLLLFPSEPPAGLYGHLLLFLTLIGGIFNSKLLDAEQDVYYAVFLLRMDARRYALSAYGYTLLKDFMGFLIAALVVGRLALQAPLALCLLTGCASLLERSYTTVEPHSSKFWESEAADTLRAENYQDIVNDLLLLIGQHMALLTPDKKLLRRRISRLGWDTLDKLLLLQEADMGGKGTGEAEEPDVFPEIRAVLAEIRAENACLTVKDLAVNGNDLMALGYQGKSIGETLNALLEGVLDETLPNERQVLLDRAKQRVANDGISSE